MEDGLIYTIILYMEDGLIYTIILYMEDGLIYTIILYCLMQTLHLIRLLRIEIHHTTGRSAKLSD